MERIHYLISPPELVEGNPIRCDNEPNSDSVHWIDVMKSGEKLETAGEVIACMTGTGKTVAKAKAKAYAAVSKVKFPDRMYRTDIGDKVIEALPKLHAWGYATEMQP
jgi:phosphoribosylamine--glycine ligase